MPARTKYLDYKPKSLEQLLRLIVGFMDVGDRRLKHKGVEVSNEPQLDLLALADYLEKQPELSRALFEDIYGGIHDQ